VTGDGQRVLVLGLGNRIHSDDGIGIHAIYRLQRDPSVPPWATLMDGGTQGLSLAPHICGFQRLLVIDAIDVGEKPGTLIKLEGDAVERMPGKPSVHLLGFADLMIAMKLMGESPGEVVVFGVQPQSTEWSTELTPPVEAALDQLVPAVIAQLQLWAAPLRSID
jgi:hydrogenase maturation protease